jgi:hypothetical protein
MITAERLAICMRLRSMEIKKSSDDGISVANLKALVPVCDGVFKGCTKFPIALSSVDPDNLARAKRELNMGEGAGSKKGRIISSSGNKDKYFDDNIETLVDEEDEDEENRIKNIRDNAKLGSFGFNKDKGNDNSEKKNTSVKLAIEKIGFKDESWEFVDPQISAYVVEAGKVKGVQVNSGVAANHEGKYYVFDQTLEMHQKLEAILPGSAIVFEFKHFKKEKKKLSTKCWAFVDREDLKEGPQVLELYKKPVDPRRKKLSLFTVKPLYLHVHVSLEK